MTNHPPSCACGAPLLPPGFNRRRFLRFTGAGVASLVVGPRLARAQGTSPYKAMLLSCVDPRTQAPIAGWMNKPARESHVASLQGKYSQFTIAGAAVGVIAPAFPKAWSETFWANFSASVELHRIENLVVVDHSNCGALRLAYGDDVYSNPKLELEAHMADVKELKRQLSIRHPDANFQAWYVARDSSGHFTKWKNLVPGPIIS